jgi:hypothetical protein
MAMTVPTKLKPNLTLHLISPSECFKWCIALNGEVIHRVHNILLFAKDIGYPDIHQIIKDNKVVISPPVALKNNNEDACLQNKLAAYLFDNCEKFEKEYGMIYKQIYEDCKKNDMKANNKCEECYVLKRSNQ